MQTNADLLLDTSAAILLADPLSDKHVALLEAIGEQKVGLAGHANFEVLSVLTRLPAPRRLSAEDARTYIETNFPHPHYLPDDVCTQLVAEFVTLGIIGGAVYDGLVGAAARHAKRPLLTCDTRAHPTYKALEIDSILL